jgi:hypothetical protein
MRFFNLTIRETFYGGFLLLFVLSWNGCIV